MHLCSSEACPGINVWKCCFCIKRHAHWKGFGGIAETPPRRFALIYFPTSRGWESPFLYNFVNIVQPIHYFKNLDISSGERYLFWLLLYLVLDVYWAFVLLPIAFTFARMLIFFLLIWICFLYIKLWYDLLSYMLTYTIYSFHHFLAYQNLKFWCNQKFYVLFSLLFFLLILHRIASTWPNWRTLKVCIALILGPWGYGILRDHFG